MSLDYYGLEGRVAIVTGGGTGIGGATALLLARHGCDVVLAGRRIEKLEAKAAELREATGRRCLTVPTDVRDPEAVDALVAQTVAELGRIDVLINNAGGAAMHAPIARTPVNAWLGGFALNMHAAFHGAQAVYPHFRAQRSGSIVNISSVAGAHGTIGVSPYSSAKAALQMFTRVAAAEWGPHGIRVNCVAPGMTGTEQAQKNWETGVYDPIESCRALPLRRPGTMTEIANAIVFLASEAASYITGETLVVSGGPQIKGMIDVD